MLYIVFCAFWSALTSSSSELCPCISPIINSSFNCSDSESNSLESELYSTKFSWLILVFVLDSSNVIFPVDWLSLELVLTITTYSEFNTSAFPPSVIAALTYK